MDLEDTATDYEVYMSFRGIDTRQGFADVLYEHMDRAGIRVFRDEDELAIGDKIDKILLTINSSRICVPIFSKTFAQSEWCLNEVRRMVELNKDVAPIFYDVTPDDVGLETPAYAEFMAGHEDAYGKDHVRDWEYALKAITKFKGWEVSDTSYNKFCKMFVGELLIKLKPRKIYDLDNVVGMDNQLESAIKLLDIGAGGVRYIVIHGMGGIGKTTLAKVIFNKLSASFDNSGFLEDLRESCRRGGLDILQKHLGDRLDPKSATMSNLSRDIRQRFQGKKVLIILDDVDSGEQIEELAGNSWFASGSRIIITTRNKDVMNGCASIKEDLVESFEVSTLKRDEALQLFTLYAFRKDPPLSVYKSLSEEAVASTGGLPLALKVIASLLRGKNERIWREVIARSRKITHSDVKKRLRISYDALEQDQQQIFLDIACFFTGTEKSNPCYMWEACDLYPIYGLEVLVSMSLLKITDENMLQMHDQLRDLGRDIVREDSISNPIKRSRIWVEGDALKVLVGKEGKHAVEALSLRRSLVSTLTDKHLKSFKNIRFLELVGANFEGDPEDLLQSLRWLSWHKCPASFNFCLENLVILDLSQSLIDENWGGWNQMQIATKLKVLDLSCCDNLTRTPDFARVHTLERLILTGCSKLATIDGSIRNLGRLKLLDLRDCHSLCGLPEELGALGDLEEILVDGNGETFKLPNSIGNLTSLVSLQLKYLEMESIPDSIGGLVKLKHLSLLWSVVEEMPESLGNLESLVKLDLDFAGVGELPSSIGGLVRLEELSLHSSRIKELPDSVWCLTSLIRLDLSGTKFSILPDSVGNLQELEVLSLNGCKIRTLPASIRKLKKLVELNADSCDFLEEVPLEIWELSSLRRLCLSRSCIQTLPSTISQLSLLQELHLEGCNKLQELPELPPCLTSLTVPPSCLKEVHDLSKLDIISSLVITDPNDLEATQKLAKLKKLELCLSKATTTQLECLSSLTELESLSLTIRPTDSASPSMALSHGSAEIILPPLAALRNLLGLEFHNCLTEDGLESLGVGELEILKIVWIDKCSSKLIEVCLAENLRSLIITDCELLVELPDLSHLKSLNALDVQGCGELSQITGLEELESLDSLSIIHCGSLERIGDLSKLKKLFDLFIDSCPHLTWIDGIDKLFIGDLTITNCEQWKSQ